MHHDKAMAAARPLMDQTFTWLMADWRNTALAVVVLVLTIIIFHLIIMRRRVNSFGEIFGHEPNLKPELRSNQQGIVSARIAEIRNETDSAQSAVDEAAKALEEAQRELREARHLEARAEKSAKTWGFEIPEVE